MSVVRDLLPSNRIANREPLPGSRKVYAPGPRGMRVPFREITLQRTRGVRGESEPNPPLAVYDTSGPYTDPDVEIDPAAGFVFVDGFDEALEVAREAAGDQDVAISGGADTIRQALRAGVVDTLALSTAPVLLGSGKRLFEGVDLDLDLAIERTVSSPWATHVVYGVKR